MIRYKGQVTFKLNIADGDSKAEGEIDFLLDKDLVEDIGFNKAMTQVFRKVKILLKQNGVDKWIKK